MKFQAIANWTSAWMVVILCHGGTLASSAETENAESADVAATNRYNVLFIAIDDLRTELGCYGLDYVQSPHLDRLASRGVLFEKHFVQVATCGASRYALLTGRSPKSSGVTRNNAAFYSGATALKAKQLPGAQSLPELFRRSGYHTTLIGKISHTPDGKVFAYNGSGDGRAELPGAWSELATPYGEWKRGWGTFFAYEGGRHRESGRGDRDLFEFTAEDDDDLPDGQMAAAAIAKLQQFKSAEQPFFLGLGFFKPHLPFVATQKDWQAMASGDVPLPPHQAKPSSPHWHSSGEFFKYNFPEPMKKTKPLSAEDQRHARRAYLACVRYVDRQVGRVLNTLEETGLAENTVVVVWGDHGWHLGDSQLWGKHTPFERAMHSTLIINTPELSAKARGQRCDALVETLDLYPTLIDLCQPKFTTTAHPLDGASLRPLLTGKAKTIRPAAISYWGGAVSVRTPTHRLIVSGGQKKQQRVELYDMTQSPDPVKNIADANPEVVKRLQQYITDRK